VDERGVLHDQRVGVRDRLAQPDRALVDAAERHHRCPGALRAERGERLRVAALGEGGDGEQLGRGHGPLAAPAVDAYGEHVSSCRHLGR
jgi:hypothetical protein